MAKAAKSSSYTDAVWKLNRAVCERLSNPGKGKTNQIRMQARGYLKSLEREAKPVEPETLRALNLHMDQSRWLQQGQSSGRILGEIPSTFKFNKLKIIIFKITAHHLLFVAVSREYFYWEDDSRENRIP